MSGDPQALSRTLVRQRLVESLKTNFLSAKAMIIALLMIILVYSAFRVIVVEYDYRSAMIAEQQALEQQAQLRKEWSQILIEYSTLAAPYRVEMLAEQELKMSKPNPKAIRILQYGEQD